MTLDEALKEIENLKGIIAEKDSKITEMEGHLKEKGEQFKKLRDMTKEEKELLSEKELELLKRQEALEAEGEALKKQTAEFMQGQRASVIKNLINKFARGNEEVAKKMEFNLNKIKDSDQAMTEEALAPLIQDSFNMLGTDVPDALRTAHNTTGKAPEFGEKETNFAETEQGKAVSEALFGKEPAKDNGGEGGEQK